MKFLTHPAKWIANLTSDATINSFTLSAEDADILDAVRQSYGGTLRVLIYKPSVVSGNFSYFETLELSSTHSNGTFTVPLISNYQHYLSASGTSISLNLVADGDMDWYKTSAWTADASPDLYYKSTDSFIGVQALRVEGSSEFSGMKQLISGSNGEDYYFSFIGREDASNVFVRVSGTLNSTIEKDFTSASYERLTFADRFTGTGDLGLYFITSGSGSASIGHFDNAIIIQNMIENGGFELEDAELISNGEFEDFTGTPDDNTNDIITSWTYGGQSTDPNYIDITTTSYNGNYAVKTARNPGGGDVWVQQTVGVTENTNYTLTFYTRGDGSQDGWYRIYDLSNSAVITSSRTGISGITYTLVAVNFTTPAGCTSIRVDLGSVSFDGISYYDSVSLKLASSVNILKVFSVTTEWDSVDSRSGNYCIKVTASADGGYIYQDISVVDGDYYTFAGCGKATSGDSFYFEIVGVQTGTTYWQSDTITSTSWVERIGTFKINGDTSVRVKGVAVTNGDVIYFDDWAMFPLIDVDGKTETATTLANSYDYGKWGTNTVGSIFIDGGDTYCIPIVSGTDLSSDKGSIALWYNPIFDYNKFYDDTVLIDLPNFLRIYYDATSYTFKGAIYNGSELIVSGTESSAQTFASGTWIHVGFAYENSTGTYLTINGSTDGQFTGTWTAQDVPSLMSIGCVSGTSTNRALGYIDDIHIYNKYLGESDFATLYTENYSQY